MSNLESIVNHMIKLNNYKTNISFPAKIVGVERLVDGFVDVKPIVNYVNPLTGDSIGFPPMKGVRLLYPSTKQTTISFPVSQGDTVLLIFQTVDTSSFINGNTSPHDPDFNSFGNLANVVAMVGFTPYQESCFNPNNYKNEFSNQDLNIVHNKNTDQEAIVSINTNGDITLKSPTKVIVESKEVEVIADKIEANNAVISTQGDVEVQGRSIKQFMDNHTHIDGEGKTTSTPQGF